MNERRIFRARYKINEPGVISHLTQRAPGREMLFLEKADYLYMLHLIKEIAAKFTLELFSLILMPNHVHVLLKQLKKNLSEAMKNLFEKYADYFNDKYERKGHVFCGPYRQAVCLDENYLFAITVYIHTNAVRAGLVTYPIDYSWSSYRPYIMPIREETFINYKYVLNILNPDIDKARQIYKGIIKEAIGIKCGDVLEDPKEMDSFRMKLNSIIYNIYNGQVINPDIFNIDFDKEIEDLKNKRHLKSPQEIEARKYLIQQLISRGFKINEIASKLGVSRHTIYRATF